jgi:lipoprotein-anchoring transpeptidase ErfK/SrfK
MFTIESIYQVARNKCFWISLGVGIAVPLIDSWALASPSINNSNNPQSIPVINQNSTSTENRQLQTNPSTPPSSPNINKPVTTPVQNLKLVLKLKERRLYVYRGEKLEVKYTVAVGKPGWETPTGNFKIIQMLKDPAWAHPFKKGVVIPPGTTNPLGKRWVAFWTDGTNSIGFHGTPNESVMGRAVSHGCVRMRNRDVIALFDKVALGTPVTVEP